MNVGIIVGPIVGLFVLALVVTGFLLYRRRRAFRKFPSTGNSPTNSGKSGCEQGLPEGPAALPCSWQLSGGLMPRVATVWAAVPAMLCR